jgi:putative heme-binding domain-containing protein
VTDVARRHGSTEVLEATVRGLTDWSDRRYAAGEKKPSKSDLCQAIAEVQGWSGTLLRWQADEGESEKQVEELLKPWSPPKVAFAGRGLSSCDAVFATGTQGRLSLVTSEKGSWYAYTDVSMPEATPVQFLGSSNGAYRVWLNGRGLFRKDKAGSLQADADRFTAKMERGINRVFVFVTAPHKAAELQLRFRRISSRADHEKLTQAALTRKGNPERGQKVFLSVEKSLCLKCHWLENRGERIGPDLTGVGSRFSRVYLIESILEPSRTIAPSFDSVVIELKDGRLLTGIPVGETETTLTLADNQGQKHVLAKTAIAERRRHPLSTMPEGLEQRLTPDEFVDLIAFLEGQKAR